jgi:peptidyl-prolyl cis-trans isomerase D
LLPLADVREKVLTQVTVRQAAAMARKEGEARLAALKAAPGAAMTEAPVTVSRVQPRDFPQPVVQAALQAPTASLPAVVGVDLPGQGYAVVKVIKVSGRDTAAPDAQRLRTQYVQALTEAEMASYYDALKLRFKVDRSAAVPQASAASATTN